MPQSKGHSYVPDQKLEDEAIAYITAIAYQNILSISEYCSTNLSSSTNDNHNCHLLNICVISGDAMDMFYAMHDTTHSHIL